MSPDHVRTAPDGIDAVIALDIDGVLNSIEFMSVRDPIDTTGVNALSGELVRRLEGLNRYRLGWLLSSTWRYDVSPEEMTRMLMSHGSSIVIFSSTPLWSGVTRGEQILSWARVTGYTGRIFALDDDGDTAPIHTVKTDVRIGLTDADVSALAALIEDESTGRINLPSLYYHNI